MGRRGRNPGGPSGIPSCEGMAGSSIASCAAGACLIFKPDGDDARSLFLLGRGFRIRLEGEAFAVLEFATDMGREAHHADGHDLTNEAK